MHEILNVLEWFRSTEFLGYENNRRQWAVRFVRPTLSLDRPSSCYLIQLPSLRRTTSLKSLACPQPADAMASPKATLSRLAAVPLSVIFFVTLIQLVGDLAVVTPASVILTSQGRNIMIPLMLQCGCYNPRVACGCGKHMPAKNSSAFPSLAIYCQY